MVKTRRATGKTRWRRQAQRVIREPESEPRQAAEAEVENAVDTQPPQSAEAVEVETFDTQETPPQPSIVEEVSGKEGEQIGSGEEKGEDSEEEKEEEEDEEEKEEEEEGDSGEEEEKEEDEEEKEEEEEGDSGEEEGGGGEENEGERVEKEGEEEEEGGEGEENEGEGVEKEGENRESEDSMEESMGETVAPLAMYFPPSQYTKKIKISTRCFVFECLQTLNTMKVELNHMERRWFENHPQFKHFFHMPQDSNHKLMGMWMILLRTASIERKREVWFVVNGVPIRYGIREHALMCGLNCKNYPMGYKEKGSMKFVNKYFGARATVRYQDIKPKLEEMEPSVDRLKMAVLYFLSSIIISPTKYGEKAQSVDPFFLRAVDDLKFCKTFPWGRYSFDHILGEISRMMEHFGGEVKEGITWVFPGFCLPLELLAFEAIPHLRYTFRESFDSADESCPRMCKSKFKKSEMRGFPLSRINKELGTRKV